MTYRSTPTTIAANDPDLIHSSTCTTLSVNADFQNQRPKTTFRVSRLEIRWLDGEVAVRFSGRAMDLQPRRGREGRR